MFKGSVATPGTGDGPVSNLPPFLSNHAASNVDNFMLDYVEDCEFWTILTAIGPDKSRQYRAHFHWRVVHAVNCLWRSEVPMLTDGGSFKILEKFVTGPPNDADLQPILTNPTGPIAGESVEKCNQRSRKRC